ncbi:MAG: hypothetical protein Kow006_16710 [Gammaproteobacteria bacterium]
MSLRSALSALTNKLGFSSKTEEPAPTPEAPQPTLNPEQDIIAVLSRAHGQLRTLMARILELAEQQKFDDARRELKRFETLMARHLATESEGFFDRLKGSLPEYAGKIQRCQADLQGVTKELKLVSEICARQQAWASHTTATLERLFDRVEERFTYEENSLFPVYLALDKDQEVMNKTQIFDRSLYARLKSN